MKCTAATTCLLYVSSLRPFCKYNLCVVLDAQLDSIVAEITTGLDAFNDDGRERAVQKPKMEIILRKSEEFDEVMANQTRAPQAAQQASGSGPSTAVTPTQPSGPSPPAQ